jgi:predicted heme/steroid binding protein/uncharacterized membrane protein
MKTYSAKELEESRTPDGHPTLVAVNGKVYDVSSSKMWKKGVHVRAHKAGEDLSLQIRSAPHGLEVMDRVEQVGLFVPEESAGRGERVAPWPLDQVLDHHPHAMSSHFPIALVMVASLSILLYVLFRHESLETFALYLLVLSTISAPVVVGTGVLSWFYNYHAVWTGIYRGKVFLSAVLFAVQIVALAIRLLIVDEPSLASPVYWLYVLLVLGLTPVVAGLGYLGGKIVFPH